MPRIEAVEVFKSFGGIRALQGASFEAGRGEVHALVGENGAGKSTLIKILSGLLHLDRGEIRLDGRDVRIDQPAEAQRLGIGTVFQELTLLPHMTVAENLLLRREPRDRLGFIRRSEVTREAMRLLDGLGLPQTLWLATYRWRSGSSWRSPKSSPALRRSSCSTSRPRPSASVRWRGSSS